jgi:hypothetical protein
MTAGRPAPTPTDHHTRRIRVVDWVLVPLAWGSAGLMTWWLFWEPTGLLRERLRLVDLGISAVFAVTICWRWLRFRTGWRYLRKHWWEVIALVPFAVLGGWAFLGYAVLAARLVRLVDRTDNVSTALEENRLELESLILDLISQDQAAGKLRRVPFHDDVVRLVSDTVFRIVHGALDDPRVHELIDDVIRNSATQLRQSVRLGPRD